MSIPATLGFFLLLCINLACLLDTLWHPDPSALYVLGGLAGTLVSAWGLTQELRQP